MLENMVGALSDYDFASWVSISRSRSAETKATELLSAVKRA